MVIFVIRSFKFLLQARLSFRSIGKESPDSIEQCTGEEPGPDLSGTDSATENNCLLALLWRGLG